MSLHISQPKRRSLAGPTNAQPFHEADPGPIHTTKPTDKEDSTSIKTVDPSIGYKRIKAPKDTTTIDGKAQIIGTAECPVEQLCCKYNEDFSLYSGGGVDGILRIFNAENNECLSSLSDSDSVGRTASITSVKHRPVTKNYPINNCFTCTYVNGLVKCWNYNYKQCIYTIREGRQTYGLAYHPRLPKFITYGDDLKIYLYDEETKIQERVLQASEKKEYHDGPTSRVFAGCFNPRSNYEFLTGGWDDVLHLWDLRAPHSIRHISGVHICGEGIDINKKNGEILTCSWRKDEQLQLWDYSSFKLISTFYPDIHLTKLYCGRFLSPEFIVCCGGDPSLLRLIDTQTSYSSCIVHSLPAAVYHLDTGPPKVQKKRDASELRQKGDISRAPKIMYTCSKKIVQLDFF